MATIIDGKAVARKIGERVRVDVERFVERRGYAPQLATVLVGDDPASSIYVRRKKEACAEAGIRSLGHELEGSTSQEELAKLVGNLNSNADVHGILVQLPLQEQIDAIAVTELIRPEKDVDGLTAVNAGRLLQGRECLVPCTPRGVMELLKSVGVNLEGSQCVIVGRSNLVGRPLISLLLHENATVTVCHSRTRDLSAVCSKADVLIAAAGSPRLITGEMVKGGATVIDVGTNRTERGLVGDVAFDEVVEKAGSITPVPGGVGPVTIAMLLENTVKAAVMQT